MRYLFWVRVSSSFKSLYDYNYCHIPFNKVITAQRVQKVILSALMNIFLLKKDFVADSTGINLYFCWTGKRIED